MSGPLRRVLDALEAAGYRPRRSGSSWTSRCPAHEDRDPSLSIGEGDDGRVLLKCHAGCSFDAIVGALGLQASDLFPRSEGDTAGDGAAGRAAVRDKRYAIRDATGALVAVHVRLDRPDGKRMWWERNGRKGLDGLPVTSLPLYGSELVAAMPANEPVIVTEGEKAADALRERGFHAVATVCGATSCPDANALAVLVGRDVILWPDMKDDRNEGVLHMQNVAAGLSGIARTVRVFEWGDAPRHGDAFDYFARGGTNESLRDDLAKMASASNGVAPSPRSTSGRTNPWNAAVDVHDFVNTSDPDSDWLVPHLIARGAVTAWFSPRGLGKTLVAHHLAADVAGRGMRVLLIDRDNPRREVRRRLRAWGLAGIARDQLRIIARDQAPPLTDTAAWKAFPVGEYDLVILDSFDSATEGIGEGDSGKPSVAVAALLDVVRATKGPAALILGNTIKSGSHGRGSGVVEDRLDIVFEVRDATGFTPTGNGDWWLELPASGRDAWADRSARRKRRDTYRLAFVPSKFRVGEEPDPICYEISCAGEPWACADVTDRLTKEGEQARSDAQAAKQTARDEAAADLKAEVIARHEAGSPIEERDEAVAFLGERGLSRKAARALISERRGRDWQVAGRGKKGEPRVLVPVDPSSGVDTAGNTPMSEPRESRFEAGSIPADQEPCGRPQSTTTEGTPNAAQSDSGLWPTDVSRGGFQEPVGGWGAHNGESAEADGRRREAEIMRGLLGGAE